MQGKGALLYLLFLFCLNTCQVGCFVIGFSPTIHCGGRNAKTSSALQLQVLSRRPGGRKPIASGGWSRDHACGCFLPVRRKCDSCTPLAAGRDNVEEANQGISVPVEETSGSGKDAATVHASSSPQIHQMKLPKPSESQPSQISLLRKPTPRLQKLRDLLFKKDVMEALTSAEFALKLDTSGLFAKAVGMENNEIRTRTTIDYDRIFRRLGACFTAIDVYGAGRISMSQGELLSLRDRLLDMQEQVEKRVCELNNLDLITLRLQDASRLDFPRAVEQNVGGVLQAAIEGRAKEVADNVRRKEEELKPVLQVSLASSSFTSHLLLRRLFARMARWTLTSELEMRWNRRRRKGG
eukprot:758882-Hanusia_phi.AAC.4